MHFPAPSAWPLLQVLVASVGEGMLEKRMQVCAQLWRLGVAAEFGYKEAPKFPQQLREANDHAIPLMVLFGRDELQRGVAKVGSAAIRVCSGCCPAKGELQQVIAQVCSPAVGCVS